MRLVRARHLTALLLMVAAAIVGVTTPAAALASPPSATFVGWGVVRPSSGLSSATAWSWSSTSRTWTSTTRTRYERVYIHPFASGWSWTWTSTTSWLAMRTADIDVPSTTSPSGEPMPVGNLAGWRQIFADDFTTSVPLGSFPAAVSTRWSAYPYPWQDTSHHGTYDPANTVSIAAGLLDVRLHTRDGRPRVAALRPRLPQMTYGRYAIRFRADPVAGYKTAWLLWPDSETWPRDGEIDFPEGDLDGRIAAFMHRQGATTGGDQDAFSTSSTYSTWHTAIIEHTPSAVRFILDGRTIGTSTSRIPNTPMHWVIQTETALDGTIPPAWAAGSVQIDWVAAYALA